MLEELNIINVPDHLNHSTLASGTPRHSLKANALLTLSTTLTTLASSNTPNIFSTHTDLRCVSCAYGWILLRCFVVATRLSACFLG